MMGHYRRLENGPQSKPFRGTYSERIPDQESRPISTMSVAKPRNRLVFFRVSEDEFQKLASMCESGTRGRSISELARSAIHRLIADGSGETTTLAQLDRRIDDLQQQVRLLTALISGSSEAPPNGAAGMGAARPEECE